jgi:Cd2+/Zn2+-exporting ATPase
MEKATINLDIVLPDVPAQRDECVDRLIMRLGSKRGIDKIHLVPENRSRKAYLCFHYDPSLVSPGRVEQLAKEEGAEITEHYGHLLIETSGVREPRHAKIIEAELKRHNGMQNVSVSGTGFIRLEYRKRDTSEQNILQQIRNSGLRIKNIDDLRGSKSKKAERKEENQSPRSIFGEKTEMLFAIICGAFLGIGFGITIIAGSWVFASIGFYVGAYFFGGFYTGKQAIKGISKGKFDIDFLMFVAAIGAAFLGAWPEGALLLFLFSLGHSLEHYAMRKAKKSISALAELAPKTALLKSGDKIYEVKIETLKPGDIIVVKPNSRISADGILVNGMSAVNQAPITGESIPVDKTPVEDPNINVQNDDKVDLKHRVFAGSINGAENLEIKVTKIASDSTIARLVKLVNEAQTQKSPTQNFADRLEKYYVPSILLLVALLLFAFFIVDEPFSASFYRAMTVLVAASPCALAISTPSAVLSGVARAARGGVLIKGGKPLEELGSLNAVAFDKTGTLTEGKPKLTGIYPLGGASEQQLLEIIIAVEKLSEHPLATAIVKGGIEKLKKDVPAAGNVSAIQGRGVKADYQAATIHIGNKEMFTEKGDQLTYEIKMKAEELEKQGNTTMIVQQQNKFIGIVTLMDTARPDAKDTLTELKKVGIHKMIMLTGDNQNVAESIAKDIGITDAWGNLLPEQKVQAIEKLKAEEKQVAMVGDGVNDAPAMAKSTVGIAMGAAGSDVALETADIALMADKLGNLPFVIKLSRAAHSIIRQNVIISLGMVVILIPLTILGIANLGPAVIGHEGSTVIVVFNALRLLAFKK